MILLYQNVRGLRTKTPEFYKSVSAACCDIIALAETYLTSSVSDGELFPPGYVVLRADRDQDRGWGGILLAVRDCYSINLITDIDGLTDDKEVIFAKLVWKNMKLLICVVYLPPSYNDKQYRDVLNCIENAVCKYSSLDVIVVGDFNLNSCSKNTKMQYDMFINFCKLVQYNSVPNSHGGILDLVLANIGSGSVAVSGDVEPFVKEDLYHPTLKVLISLPRSISTVTDDVAVLSVNDLYAPDWDFRKADFCSLYAGISTIDWSEVIQHQDIDLATDLFYLKLNEYISGHVPVRKYRNTVSRNYPPWFTAEIIKKLKIKYFHFLKFKEKGLQFNREVFVYYRSHVKELIDVAYQQYIRSVGSNISCDPKYFWKYVKERRSDRSQRQEYTLNGQTVVGQEAVNAFADYFGSVFLPDIPVLDAEAAARSSASADSHLVSIDCVTLADLRRAARRLKASSAAGPDAIPPFLVKDCLSALEAPLLHLYNLSLRTGCYPSRWKISRVTPVPKIRSSSDISMFRPIAILGVFNKLFEIIISWYLTRQIEAVIDDSQHGFRAGRSTTTNHIHFVDYVTTQMDARQQVDAVFLDFRRAFDMVDNDLLLIKLSTFGCSPKLLKFLADYLKDRRQYVQLKMFKSNEFYTRSGVSQGSTLGPTLFLVMINDLPKVLSMSRCLMFADDLKVYQSVKCVSDCIGLQRDIVALEKWSTDNRLSFNISKCSTMTFSWSSTPIRVPYTLSGATLQKVNSIRDLGVMLDSHLDFKDHIISACRSANKTLGFIMRTASHFSDINVAIILYNSLVRSKLEFECIVWDPPQKKYMLLIERIQRKFARYIYNRMYGYYPFMYPSLFVLGMVTLETLELRRRMRTVIHYCMILHGKIVDSTVLSAIKLFVPDTYVRSGERRRHNLFICPVSRTSYARNAPTQRALALLNATTQIQDVDVFFDSIRTIANMFKAQVYKSKIVSTLV